MYSKPICKSICIHLQIHLQLSYLIICNLVVGAQSTCDVSSQRAYLYPPHVRLFHIFLQPTCLVYILLFLIHCDEVEAPFPHSFYTLMHILHSILLSLSLSSTFSSTHFSSSFPVLFLFFSLLHCLPLLQTLTMWPLSFMFHSSGLPRPTVTQPRRCPMVCKMVPPAEDYRHAEMLDDAEAAADMTVWNSVIHASLKRKLAGLVAEHPVANGVSALLHAAPGYPVGTVGLDSDRPPVGLNPVQVCAHLLSELKRDALAGAAVFCSLSSSNCHVKFTAPHTLVLFIGDNDSYRPLLRVSSFLCGLPRFEDGAKKCVVSVNVHSPVVTEEEPAKFDFQLSCDDAGSWLIDEVFRL